MPGKSLVLTIIGYTLLAVFVLSGAYESPENHQEFCHEGRCVTFDVNLVVNHYPNLLVEKVPKFNPHISEYAWCCPTRQIFDSPKFLKNINGVERIIVQTKRLHQIIPRGRCLTGGKCETCRILTRTMTILVVDFDSKRHPPVEFDQFDIPIYCACFHNQNIAVRDFENFQETYMGTKD